MLRVSWPEYLFDPLQHLLSPSTSGDRSRSQRHLLWSTQAEHRIKLSYQACQVALHVVDSRRTLFSWCLMFRIILIWVTSSLKRERYPWGFFAAIKIWTRDPEILMQMNVPPHERTRASIGYTHFLVISITLTGEN